MKISTKEVVFNDFFGQKSGEQGFEEWMRVIWTTRQLSKTMPRHYLKTLIESP
jgi:hypothetical protein